MVSVYDLNLKQKREATLEEFQQDMVSKKSLVPMPDAQFTMSKDDEMVVAKGSEIYSKMNEGFSVFNPQTTSPENPNPDGLNPSPPTGNEDDDTLRDLESRNLSTFKTGLVSGLTMDINTLFDSPEARKKREDLKAANPIAHGAGYVAGTVGGLLGSGGAGAVAKGVGFLGRAGSKLIAKGASKVSSKQLVNVRKGMGVLNRSQAAQSIAKAAKPAKKIAKKATKFLDYTPVSLVNKMAIKAGAGVTKGATKLGAKRGLANFTGRRVSDATFGVAFGAITSASEIIASEKDDARKGENGAASSMYTIAKEAASTGVSTAAFGAFLGGAYVGGKAGLGLANKYAGKPLGKFFKNFLANQALGTGTVKQKNEFRENASSFVKEYLESASPEAKASILKSAGIKKITDPSKLKSDETSRLAVSILSHADDGILKNVSVKDNKLSVLQQLDKVGKQSGKITGRLTKSVGKNKTDITGESLLKQITSRVPVTRQKGQLSKFRKIKKETDDLKLEAQSFILEKFRTKQGGWSFTELKKILGPDDYMDILKINKRQFLKAMKGSASELKNKGVNQQHLEKIIKDDSMFELIFKNKTEFKGLAEVDEAKLVKKLMKKYKLNGDDIGLFIDSLKADPRLFSKEVIQKEGVDQLKQRMVGSLTEKRKDLLRKHLSPEDYKKYLKHNSSYGLIKEMTKNVTKDGAAVESAFAFRDMFNVGTLGLGVTAFTLLGPGFGAMGLLGAGFMVNYMLKSGTGILKTSQVFNSYSQRLAETALKFKNLSDPKWLKKKQKSGLRGVTYSQLSQSLFGVPSESIEDFGMTLHNSMNEVGNDPTEVAATKEAMFNQQEDSSMSIASVDFTKMRILKQVHESFQKNIHHYDQIPNFKDKKKDIARKIKSFERDIEVLFDPQSLMSNMSNGYLTPQMIENFKNAFPSKYQEMQTEFFIAYRDNKLDNLTRKQIRTLSRFMGYDLTGLQGAVFGEDEDPLAKPSQGYEGSLKQKELQQSPVQRVESL